MTLLEFKKKENLSDDEFEYYCERTGIMIYDGKISSSIAHKYAMEQIKNRRQNGK